MYILLFWLSIFINPTNGNPIKPQKTDYNESLSDSSIRLLTLNTWGLPIWYPGSNKQYRYPKICNALAKKDFNIICLQEVFDQKLKTMLFNTMQDKGYKSSNDFDCTRKVKNLVKMDCEGGLLTWSKYPIVGHVFIPFPIEKTMNFEEKIGRKGFTITKIQAPKGLISVINTHLYAGNSEKCESFRLKQIQFIESYLSAKNGDIQNPVFFAGDFNTYSSEGKNSTCYDYIINQLNFCDTEIGTKENTFTYDHKTNFFAALNHSRQKLDHIFYKCNNAQMSISVDQSRVQFIHEESVSDHNGYSSMINLTYLDQIHTLTSSAAETSRTISKTQ